MIKLLPVNIDIGQLFARAKGTTRESKRVVNISPSIALLERIQNGTLKLPSGPKELNHENVLFHQMSVSAAIELGIPVGDFKEDGNSSVVVQDYAKYRELADGGARLLVGVAVRYSVAFQSLNTAFRINSVPAIAAAIQLNIATASARFEVLGMGSSKITSLIPIVDKLDVEKYALYAEAQKAIKALVWDAETYVEPVPLAVYVEVTD